MSHIASDIEPEALGKAKERVSRLALVEQTYRSHAEVMQFFDGLEMVEPGLVRVQEWRPGSELEAKSPAALWGGVGRKRLEGLPPQVQDEFIALYRQWRADPGSDPGSDQPGS